METIMSGEFARMFFVLSTAVVLSITWFGYYRNVFITKLSVAVVAVLVVYMTTFLIVHFMNREIAEHVSSEKYYALIASMHGILSLWAVIQTCVLLLYAARAFKVGKNYFTEHRTATLTLALVWPLSLISGMFL